MPVRTARCCSSSIGMALVGAWGNLGTDSGHRRSRRQVSGVGIVVVHGGRSLIELSWNRCAVRRRLQFGRRD
jgi:hypothetical protein